MKSETKIQLICALIGGVIAILGLTFIFVVNEYKKTATKREYMFLIRSMVISSPLARKSMPA